MLNDHIFLTPQWLDRDPMQWQDAFVRGSARIMICDTNVGKFIDDMGEIIVLSGPTLYDPQPWMLDLGSSKTGIRYSSNEQKISIQIADRHPQQIVDAIEPEAGEFCLMALMLAGKESVRAYIWNGVMLMPMEMQPPWQGGAMNTPCDFIMVQPDGRIIEHKIKQ